ncbi:MAG: bifunctional proline dehydrogenase/L-glutamate gamma-semialdehyde dehydrogenase [Parachlamydiaceae bacterium]|nr:bifunctional proline dehydrogenase/L-glutamate gamma-semialdehyde dehydrogenase [Parachlamydiaceae bacterium]
MASTKELIDKANTLIASVKGKIASIEELQEKAIDLAALLLKDARIQQTPKEKDQQELLGRMMKDPQGKIFTVMMTDQCFRSHSNYRVADQLSYILKKYGIPRYLSFSRRLGMRFFKNYGKMFSSLSVPLVKALVRKETDSVILPGESELLAAHMARRRKEGVRVNLNHLGEAILGEAEANHRLQVYLEDLENPDVEYISVKISTICSQLNLLAWDDTVALLAEQLRLLYRAAQNNHYTRRDGTKQQKFVNLDMEEYRDLHLTIDLFCKVLSEPEFHFLSAGIVLQAYLPDAILMQQRLTTWAMDRACQGGAPIKIRIVKGANLAMEQVESAMRNWPQAPYRNKLEVDANYKRMVEYGCLPARAKAVNLGIGSHNLFDIALALLLRSQNGVESYVCFEMLEGMADHIRRSVQAVAGDMLLYCPAAKKEEFQHAVAYLVRRLDENTAPENFLRSIFGLTPGSPEWKQQVALFIASCKMVHSVSAQPRRTQNRQEIPESPNLCAAFENEADTDWSLGQNVAWAKETLAHWKGYHFPLVPLVFNGQNVEKTDISQQGVGKDPSYPEKELFRYSLASQADIEAALLCAEKAFPAWTATSPSERSLLLAKIAQGLRVHRQDLLGAMTANTGKTLAEGDIELSEAIDFAEYYRRNIEELHYLDAIEWTAMGTVLVAPPWNFPCSIPAGGLLASLATGNCVLFKPASEAVFVGWILANIFWEAGVSKEVLQFIACEDEPIGSLLVKNPRVSTVILTGATSTAKLFFKMRPGLNLIAETGGKNALIISGLSDRDLAIKDLISSAFGHSGQKCSACSLAILEAEVYDDLHFRTQLRDAAHSLFVGSPWDLRSKVTPLINEPKPGSALYQALTQLEPGEEWLLEPVQDVQNRNLWSPGIKLGVKPQSLTHMTEFFGPILGLMRAPSLSEAIELANGTPYGLTSGLHSLDFREQEFWIGKIEAGNCYINRGITGAIVQRQPFGGCKESSFGPGTKAGGPNYLMSLMHAREKGLPKEKGPVQEILLMLIEELGKGLTENQKFLVQSSAENYAFYQECYFSKDHDPSAILGQHNILRYIPRKQLLLRLNENDVVVDLLRIIVAAKTVKCLLEISGNSKVFNDLLLLDMEQNLGLNLVQENEGQLINRLQSSKINNVRMLSRPSGKLEKAFAELACNVTVAGVVGNGRVELLHFLREVSLSNDYHRYGNLVEG